MEEKELSWIRIVQSEPVPAILGDQLVLVSHCLETITVDVLKWELKTESKPVLE